MSFSIRSFHLHAAATWLALALAGAGAVAVEPAQIPLTSRVSIPPPPNFMVTIDDSGSMLADFMPEDDFTLNGFKVNLSIGVRGGTGYIGGYPNDVRKSNARLYDGVVVGLAGDATNVYQRQYRSPDVNRIYYNPDIRYYPWVAPGGGLLPDSPPANAAIDPTSPTVTRNLTARWKNIDASWCTAANTCVWETRNFDPGLYYRLKDKADPTQASSYVPYNINDANKYAPATPGAGRTECVDTDKKPIRCTQEQERQNFANWFTYHRMRETLTKAAVSKSLSQYVDKLRVGWAHINKTTEYSVDGGKMVSRVETEAKGGPMRPFSAARMKTVLTGIQAVRSSGSTPLRYALDAIGSYFDRPTKNIDDQKGNPWLEDPANPDSRKLSCRRSVSLLMTDGYYNDNDYKSAGDADGSSGPPYVDAQNPNGNPPPNQYEAIRPFIDEPDAVSNTLADVATQYFKKDLDPNIQNKVRTRTDDIAYWQHLTQFMVGLGVRGTLDSSTPDAKKVTIDKIRAGDLHWPVPSQTNAPTLIDDMWHAAFNTGGDFYSVANGDELTKAFASAIEGALSVEAKEAGVATAAPFTTADNVKYVPKYQSVKWYGDLEAYELTDTGDQESLKWKASDKVPAPSDRNLFTWDVSSPLPFTWGGMGSANQALVGSAELTDFIRGDHSQEGEGKLFRDRSGKVLADFVNSPPVLVGNYLDMGYAAFDPTYTDYLSSKSNNRAEPLIVLGGNGGMVHFFRGSDGTEVFGYLPKTGLANLKLIASKDYGTNDSFHRFFVDGPMTEADAKIGGQWTNMVLGAMGAGGKGFFALRVPTAYGGLTASDFGADTVMWDKSGVDDEDIGYMFADFATGKVKGGGWKAFIGNGVYSTSGDAVLLVVDLADGTVERIKVDDGGDTGLMGVSLIRDVTSNEVVGAYAGDLKGNLWRFDVVDGVVKVGFGGNPLFVATDPSPGQLRQPITAPPVFVNHTEYGRVVLFGTGKLINKVDSDNVDVQTYYGVWDKTPIGASSDSKSPFADDKPNRSALQQQQIDTTPVEDKGGTFFNVVSKEVDWVTQKGWYIDLPWSRQRVIYPSIVLAGEYVYFSTIVPAAPASQCDASSGEGYNFLLHGSDGGVTTEPLFDTNGDGKINGDDKIVQGVKTPADGRDTIIKEDDKNEPDPPCVDGWRTYYRIDTTGQAQKVRVPCSAISTGPKDRVWKQIVNPPTGG
ncbi:pilus assembly protein [Ideonella sp.]|uniref:pilus assembly protein n=1 Tax=Ideonella sp. TaxID=1929293 RepID=UPI0035AE82C1